MLQDQRIKTIKIALCRFTFKTKELVRIAALLNERERSCQLRADLFEFFHRDPLWMVAGGAFQHPAGIVDLAQNKILRIGTAQCFAVGNTVLRLAQQDVAAFFTDSAGQKLAVRAEETQVDASAGAAAHQGRAGSGAAETEDAFQCVERDTPDLGLFAADYNVFSVQREISVFERDIERV